MVYAHWQGLPDPVLMGTLEVNHIRGKEIFSFEYETSWLNSNQSLILDPDLGYYSGPQYIREGKINFGIFLDSSPDRWGRVLMQRREAYKAKNEDRPVKPLMESDYLLGVFDEMRMGALRFKLSSDGPFLDNQIDMSAPPWTRLRDLEYASLQLEKKHSEEEKDYMQWLKMLIAPGGSLGGARPKAGVMDLKGHPWIAKFPSQKDEWDIGLWEYLVHQLAQKAGIITSPTQVKCYSGDYHTFLTKRFDRTASGERIHFASAMTLLGKMDGDKGETGVSYLHLAELIIRYGAQANFDLEQLWRRIVFNICVSNTDDHLRNHGFLLTEKGWILSPAYDMNPTTSKTGLSLNISEYDNSLSLDLAREVAPVFRVKPPQANVIINEVVSSVKTWPHIAKKLKIPGFEIQSMKNAFLSVE